MRLFCFGYGYSAESLARRLSPRDIVVAGTRTSLPEAPEPGVELAAYRGDAPSAEVRRLLSGTTHLLVSIPPDLEGDVVLRHYRERHRSSQRPCLDRLPVDRRRLRRSQGRLGRRRQRNAAGLRAQPAALCRPSRRGATSARETGRRVEIFRLSGIYGPGRSVVDNLKAGTARRIVKPGQVFNRIHVDDIARVLAAAIDKDTGHSVYNVSDDEPAPPEDVVAYAAELLGLPVPPALPFEAAGLNAMAASFWAESKRVSNTRIRTDLGVELLYPTYREGLRALAVS